MLLLRNAVNQLSTLGKLSGSAAKVVEIGAIKAVQVTAELSFVTLMEILQCLDLALMKHQGYMSLLTFLGAQKQIGQLGHPVLTAAAP